MMKNTQTTAHQRGTIRGHGIFVLTIALAFSCLAAPIRTSAQTWRGAGWGSWPTPQAAWTNYQDANDNAADPAAPDPSGTASPTDSTSANNDATAIDPSATTNASADAAGATSDATEQPSGQTILPSMVTALMVTDTSSSQVTLRWNSATDTGGPGLAGYQVYRNGVLVGTTTATEFTDTTVAPSTPYCYAIIAVDIGGNDALASAEACITTPSGVSSNSGASWYVDNTATGLDNGTSWANAWTNLNSASGVNPGDTVYISGGTSSQTYWQTNSSGYAYIALASGTNGANVTYMVGQDAGHNGTVIINGGNTGQFGFGGAVSFVTINGSYNGQNNLVISNFTNQAINFSASMCSNVNLHYLALYNDVTMDSPIGCELDHITKYVAPNLTSETCAFTFNTYPSFFLALSSSTSYLASTFFHDNTVYVYRDGVVGGNGDVCVTPNGYSTISNCTFKSVVLSSYGGSKHQEAIQIGGMEYLRVMDCTSVNMEYAGFFGGASDPVSAHDIQYLNNLFYYTDRSFTGGTAAVDIIFGGGGGTSMMYNVVIANNTFADANYGLQVGPYDTLGVFSNVVVVNNLCTNNDQAGISCIGTNGASTNNVLCLYNKASSVTPANLAGPATANAVTFLAYTSYATNNNFGLATNDVGAIGNGTNWPASIFTADIVGKPRTNYNGAWDIGAYQH
jgi:hypothetical protein